jgi:hypothetical protein
MAGLRWAAPSSPPLPSPFNDLCALRRPRAHPFISQLHLARVRYGNPELAVALSRNCHGAACTSVSPLPPRYGWTALGQPRASVVPLS